MIGYACINMALREQEIFTNRTMRKATLEREGPPFLSSIIQQNLEDLLFILKSNEENDLRFFRISSEIFPFYSHPIMGYEIEDLPDSQKILSLLSSIGSFATKHGHRLTTHPGPFNVLASAREEVVFKTIRDLNCHSKMFDYMGFEPSHYNKINIHVGGAYGDKKSALARFCANFDRLSDSCKKRLTVENDDRANLYSTKDLYEGVYRVIGIPIVFDYHHHKFNTGDQTEQEALELAISTWKEGVIPVVHYSESKTLHAGEERETPAHSDLVYGPMNHYHNSVDVMVEAKHKERAIETLQIINSVSD